MRLSFCEVWRGAIESACRYFGCGLANIFGHIHAAAFVNRLTANQNRKDGETMKSDLAARFEENRVRLRAVAYRMLGSQTEADDAIQEAWLRLNRADGAEVENLGGWLTTVVARVCLDVLRSRKLRREDPLDSDDLYEAGSNSADQEMQLADSIGPALLVVLETLAPSERIAFVLHDLFGISFDEIAGIVGKSPAAARQLASRARRRVHGTDAVPDAGRARQRELVGAFLAASRAGDFQALLSMLDPDVVLRSDPFAAKMGATAEALGAEVVARTVSGRAHAARLALLDGVAGAIWSQNGKPRVAFVFTVEGGKITAIDLRADPAQLASLDVVVLET
jgi:RNA polymerase sigma-70 factor (ECF subfamily)